MTDILDRLFDRSYDLEETLHDVHDEITELRKENTKLKTTLCVQCAKDVGIDG